MDCRTQARVDNVTPVFKVRRTLSLHLSTSFLTECHAAILKRDMHLKEFIQKSKKAAENFLLNLLLTCSPFHNFPLTQTAVDIFTVAVQDTFRSVQHSHAVLVPTVPAYSKIKSAMISVAPSNKARITKRNKLWIRTCKVTQ